MLRLQYWWGGVLPLSVVINLSKLTQTVSEISRVVLVMVRSHEIWRNLSVMV